MTKSKKSVEDEYEKIEQYDHIIRRPKIYLGSIKKEKASLWIFNENKGKDEPTIIMKEISYVPGLYKIYDEILVNARDHVIRCKDEKKTPLCTKIKVNVDAEMGKISVWNNGAGIPVVIHSKHKMLIPSLIFGELMSGSNYDDTKQRKVGGLNGLGAKITNIFSTLFEVETVDADTDQYFYQKFQNNMLKKNEPVIKSAKGKKPYTKITFFPDLKKFGIEKLSQNVISLFKKRVYDIAMNTNVKVYYNDELIEANNFSKYIDLYIPGGEENGYVKIIDTSCKDWRVCAIYDSSDLLEHQHISFVNGICTSRGGTHVDHVTSQITKKLKSYITKKIKNAQITPSIIKDHLIFFIDTVQVNPDFDSQSKEFFNNKISDFSSTYNPSSTFIKKIIKSGVMEQIMLSLQMKENIKLKNSTKGTQQFAKHYPAHKANHKEGYKCTLILTEGDSAKGFAMSGLGVVGRDYYGIFPVRGKVLNVRNVSLDKVAYNEEIKAITKIIGLDYNKDHEDTIGLNYGKIMILTDQDVDGSHIKGLIINYFHYFWPSLLKIDGFIRVLSTPLIKITKRKGKNIQKMEFPSIDSYKNWKEEHNEKGWSAPKYYKGLGTHGAQEARELFREIEDRTSEFYWAKNKKELESEESDGSEKEDKDEREKEDKGEREKEDKGEREKEDKGEREKGDNGENEKEDKGEREKGDNGENENEDKGEGGKEDNDESKKEDNPVLKPKYKDISKDAITLAFEKKREDDRKLWINTYDPSNSLNETKKRISYYEFIHKQLIEFSVYNVVRAIPNVMDGNKPSQRKIIFGSFIKKLFDGELKVAQLGAAVSELTDYHHGEESLFQAITAMGQNFVGSNNINIFTPNGNFGSRLSGGKDAASPRYIYVEFNPLMKIIYNENDSPILQQQYEEGKMIEPVYYAPIIPMILVNGTEGIGTGWMTQVWPCNPYDIYDNLKRIINNKKPYKMMPWYRNFRGSIEHIEGSKYVCRGVYEIEGDKIHITELPIGMWTDSYREHLVDLTNVTIHESKKETQKRKIKEKKTKNSKTARKKASKSPKKKESFIKKWSEDCTDARVDFTIEFKSGMLNKLKKEGKLLSYLKLSKTMNLSNMNLFDENNKIRHYKNYGSILKNYARIRLDLYQKRKDYLLQMWKKEIEVLKWRVKFVLDVIKGTIIVFDIRSNSSKKKAEVMERLEELEYPKLALKEGEKKSYKYLKTDLFDFTQEKIDALKNDLEVRQEKYKELKNKTPKEIWLGELEEFIKAYGVWDKEQTELYHKNLATKSK
jgi:DNA gyrase/topoisomerase IV subunit B